jgi:hypothetical protein
VTLRGRAAQAALAAVLLASTVALLRQRPFAFYSPDVAYHMSRVLRAGLGEPFTDPFSGTPAVLPGLFHFLWGHVERVLGIDAFAVARWSSALNIAGAFAAFAFLAREALGDRERAAAAALSLGLVLVAPTGRYMLVANPVNLSLAFLFAGFALVFRSLRTNALRDWALGLFLLSFAVNLSWYQGLAAAGVTLVPLARLLRERRLTVRVLAVGLAAILVPTLWTIAHLWTVRAVLPVYRARSRDLVTWTLDASVVREWAVTHLTHWNLKFLPQMWPDPFASAVFLGLVMPASVVLLLWPLVVALRRRASTLPAGANDLLAAAGLVLLASFVMSMTRDGGRVSPIQFVSWSFLLLFAWRTAPAIAGPRAARAAGVAASLAGVACLASGVLHADEPFEGMTSATRATVDFIAGLPDHAHTRIFVSEAHLRRLTPFVAFWSFVNHRSGLYASQDPVSAEQMLAAYRSILAHDADATASRARYGVEWLAFRHRDAPDQQALAAAYVADGGTEAFRNREWVVVHAPLREAPPSR